MKKKERKRSEIQACACFRKLPRDGNHSDHTGMGTVILDVAA